MDITDDAFIRHVSEDDPEAIEPDVVTDPDDDVEVYDVYDAEVIGYDQGGSGFINPDLFDILSMLDIDIMHDKS